MLKEQRDAFLKDAVDHYNKGVELNVLRKSALTAIVKKNNVDTHNSSNSRMQSSSDSTNNIRNASTNNRANLTLKKPVLPRGSGEGAKLAGLGSNSTFGNDDMSTRKINRKKSLRRVASTRLMSMSNLHGAIPNNDFNDIVEENLFETVEDNINNETDEVNFSFYYKTTDEFEFDDDISEYDLEAEEEFLLELQEDATDAMVNNKNSGGNSSGPTTNRGVEAFLGVGKYVNSVSKTPTTNVTTADTTKTGKGSEYDFDYTTKLSALVRLNYVESVVDLVAKWFPCLFR